jgi:hypothetical protein
VKVLVLIVLFLAFAEQLREWLAGASFLAQFLGAIVLLFVLAVVLLIGLDIQEEDNDSTPQRSATRREATEWALRQWHQELKDVGTESPRGAECRKQIEKLEARLANWPQEWDREDARLGA